MNSIVIVRGSYWPGVIACAIFYGIVFVTVHYQFFIEPEPPRQGLPGMLLFVLPGVLSALTSRQAPLTVAVLGPLLATPFCIVLVSAKAMWLHCFWQECAFSVSAMFWCGIGALGVMLGRTLLAIRRGEE